MNYADADRWHWRAARCITVGAAASAAGQILENGPGELVGWSLAAGSAISSLANESRVVAPAAGATIATIALPQGTFTLEWTVQLDGAAAAADENNFQLFFGGAATEVAVNGPVAGTYPQPAVDAVAGSAGLIIAVKAIGAGTAGVGYSAILVARPTNDGFGLILDGGQVLAVISLSPGSSDTQGPGSRGVRFYNSVAVLASVGVLTGVLYVADLKDPSGEP